MANTVKAKRSSVQGKVPTTGDILLGEIGVNTYDGKLFLKKSTTGSETGVGTSVIEVGAVSDGDKGDITVSSSGTNWVIDNQAVTYSKIQNVSSTDKILGRSSPGAGQVEEITCTSAGRDLIDDADASAQRTTLGLKTGATTNITTSTLDPSGGSDGDIWIKYTA
jgi:hypothetical protein